MSSADPFCIPPSMRLQNLENEPGRLLMEADRLNNELDGLVMENYRVFIENLTCSAYLRSEDKLLKSASRELLDHLRSLSQQSTSFKERGQQLIATHQRNRKTLQHHMQLIELLEIPQLVEACARNGFYDESIDIAAHITHLASLLKDVDNSVVRGIVDDIHMIISELRSSLLFRLSSESSLPKLIVIVGAIRRIDQLLLQNTERTQQAEEFEVILMMNYLEARSVYLKRGLSASSSRGSTAYALCVEMIETCRSSWHSAVSQFSAVFNTNNSNSGNSCSAMALLSVWFRGHVSGFLMDLRVLAEAIEDPAALRSVLEQCLSFAGRMSAVGADFTSEAVSMFREIVVARISALWKQAASNTATLLVQDTLTTSAKESNKQQTITLPLFLPQDEQGAASLLLLNYPPLAYLFNVLVMGVNLLREIPLKSLEADSYELLREVLTDVCRSVVGAASTISRRGQVFISSENTRRIMQQHVSRDITNTTNMSSVFAEIIVAYLAPQAQEMHHAVYTAAVTRISLAEVCKQIFDESHLLLPQPNAHIISGSIASAAPANGATTESTIIDSTAVADATSADSEIPHIDMQQNQNENAGTSVSQNEDVAAAVEIEHTPESTNGSSEEEI